MSYSGPFRNYDQWLTTDPLYEAQSAAADAEVDAWYAAAESLMLPEAACEEGNPLYHIFEKWQAFYEAAMNYHYEQEVQAEMEWEAAHPDPAEYQRILVEEEAFHRDFTEEQSLREQVEEEQEAEGR